MAKLEKSSKNLTLRDFVKLPFTIYKIVGIKLFAWDANDYMTSTGKFLLVINVFNMVVNYGFKMAFVLFDTFEDTVQMSKWTLYYGFAMNSFCKMCSVAFGRKTLQKVLKELEVLFPRTEKERRDFRLTEGYAYVQRHAKIMAANHWTIAFMFVLFPIIQSSVEYLLSKDDDFVFVKRLPYIFKYPFDEKDDLYGFLFAYATQFWAGFTLSAYFVGSDVLLLCTIGTVNLQFEYLCYRIKHFESKDFDTDMNELNDVLEKHYILNDLAEKVNNVFSLSILFNYMISILVIVLIGIQIVTGTELLDFVKFVGFFTSATIQVYYVCMFGTQLMENSAEVGDSFIGQEWYEADVRYQRMLVLAIVRSQKPAHLTAFKFFPISMESFSNLMTTSYQFFTLLKTRMEEDGF